MTSARRAVSITGFDNTGLGEIDVALDHAQRFVVDVMLIPQLDQLLALDLQRLANEVVEMRGRQLRGIGFDRELAAILELREPVAILVPQPGNPMGVIAGLINQCFDVSEGCLVCFLAGNTLLVMRFTVIRNTQRADEERQRKTLEDKRDKDDAERKKDDLIAPGEGCSGGGGKRQRKGGCERHDTPHARPRDDRDMLPSGIGIAGAELLC